MGNLLLDTDSLQSFRELQSEDDPHFVRDYYLSVIESMNDQMSKLEQAILKKDFTQIAAHGHAVKSAAGNAGLTTVSVLGGEFETQAQSNPTQITIEKFQALKTLWDQAVAEIRLLPELKK